MRSLVSLCTRPVLSNFSPPSHRRSLDAYVVSVSKDASWCLNDLSRGVCLTRQSVSGGDSADGFTCSQFHPDGLILATGMEKGLVRLWDIREQQNVASCEGHTASVLALSFNENGYLLASGGADGVAHIWDLRKIKSLSKISGDLSLLWLSRSPLLSTPKQRCDCRVIRSLRSVLCFLPSFLRSDPPLLHPGTYLASGADDGSVAICVVKEWSPISVSLHLHLPTTSLTCSQQFAPHEKSVTGIAWGEKASSLVSSSMDRTIKVRRIIS
jgi:WD40 repeat protein